MSEYQTLRPAPGAPPQEIAENLLPWHAPFDNEPDWTGVRTDEDIQERLTAHRDMPVHEALEIGSPYRSDRRPGNFRLAQFFIPDGLNNAEYDFQVNFPVWAIAFAKHYIFQGGGANGPFGYGTLAPYGIGISGSINLPHSLSTIQIHFEGNAGFVTGTGYHIWAFDRWVPPIFGAS